MANKFINGFIHSKWWARILVALVSLLLFLVIVNWLLKVITNHNNSLPVPKVTGLTYEEATRILDEKDLRYVVFDSVYKPKAKKGEVIDQNPAEGSKVKEKRVIYLTLNARPVPIVEMPDIFDIGLREAVSKLEAAGLEPGEITTVPDRSVNRVLGTAYKGKPVRKGDKLEKGSRIDLRVSKGEEEGANDVTVPDLIGLTLEQATTELSLAGLNVGTVVYDKNVTDKNFAVVYKHQPEAGSGAYTGKEIDLFLKEAE